MLYVSPLKALVHDVDRNLRSPLAGIAMAAGRLGTQTQEVRVGMRTGDTPAEERRAFGKHPPDILVTTPEFAVPAAHVAGAGGAAGHRVGHHR